MSHSAILVHGNVRPRNIIRAIDEQDILPGAIMDREFPVASVVMKRTFEAMFTCIEYCAGNWTSIGVIVLLLCVGTTIARLLLRKMNFSHLTETRISDVRARSESLLVEDGNVRIPVFSREDGVVMQGDS
jgi:hypothetical protein